MRNSTLPLINVHASRDLEELVDNVLFVLLELKLLLTDQVAQIVDLMRFSITDFASASKDLPITQLAFAQLVTSYQMDS